MILPKDPVELLQTEFIRRSRKNTGYSLRSFARTLGLSPTTLSFVLRRKRKVTFPVLDQISGRLNISPLDLEGYRLFIERRTTLAAKPLPRRTKSATEAVMATQELFEILSDWRCLAIFSALELPKGKSSPEWVADHLGFGRLEVKSLIEKLISLGMLERKGKQLKQKISPIRLDDRSSTQAARFIQRQFLNRAVESLEAVPANLRDITTMTFTLDKKDIAYAVERIAKFRRELTEELEVSKTADAVYNLSIQLYPLTKDLK